MVESWNVMLAEIFEVGLIYLTFHDTNHGSKNIDSGKDENKAKSTKSSFKLSLQSSN